MNTLKITVVSPETNRHGDWTIKPASTLDGPKKGWSVVIEPDGYIRVCHNSVAKTVIADLRTYPHTEIES
jgi:hypothetical protein